MCSYRTMVVQHDINSMLRLIRSLCFVFRHFCDRKLQGTAVSDWRLLLKERINVVFAENLTVKIACLIGI